MKEDLDILNDSKFCSFLLFDRIVELFTNLGIRNLNMDDICRQLKISKKTPPVCKREDLIRKLFEYDQINGTKKMEGIKSLELNAIDILIQVSLPRFDEMGKLN